MMIPSLFSFSFFFGSKSKILQCKPHLLRARSECYQCPAPSVVIAHGECSAGCDAFGVETHLCFHRIGINDCVAGGHPSCSRGWRVPSLAGADACAHRPRASKIQRWQVVASTGRVCHAEMLQEREHARGGEHRSEAHPHDARQPPMAMPKLAR